MVEEKFNYRHVGEPSQRQGYQGESRGDMILSHVRRGEGKKRGEMRTRFSSQDAQSHKERGYQNGGIIWQGQPSPRGWRVQVVVGCASQEGPATGLD